MAKTEESKLEKDIERLMQTKGVWQLARYQAQSNQNGLPDRLYLYKGYLLGLELKTDEGTPTKLQLKKIAEINRNGGIGLIVRNVKTVEMIIECINAYEDVVINYTDEIRYDIEKWMEKNGY